MVKRALVLFATLTSALAVLAPGRAVATPPVECVGTLTGGSFDNVVVPAGASCDLAESVVRGRVRVLEDATLQAYRNTIGGNVEAHDADGVRLTDNRIEGNVHVMGGGPAPPGFPNMPEFLLCGNDLPSGHIMIARVTGGIGIRHLPAAAAIERCSGPNTLAKGNIVVMNNENTRVLRVQNNVVSRGHVFIADNVITGIRVFITDNVVSKGSLVVDRNTITGIEALIRSNAVSNTLRVGANTGPASKQVTANSVARLLVCERNDPPFLGGPNLADRAEGQCF